VLIAALTTRQYTRERTCMRVYDETVLLTATACWRTKLHKQTRKCGN